VKGSQGDKQQSEILEMWKIPALIKHKQWISIPIGDVDSELPKRQARKIVSSRKERDDE
jgi:hypothetical protein